MSFDYIFTVFTPTYNRAHTIHRVYNSLISQTFNNFEWLIIDDGSIDNTYEVIKKWQNDSPFPIRYYYQNNTGMLPSVRKGLELAKGEFFLKADSDDSFKKETLYEFYEGWRSIPLSERHRFAGVTCLVEKENGEVIGDRFPEENFDSTRAALFFRHKVKGEKWGFNRTEVMLTAPIPEEHGRNYAMGLVLQSIGEVYKTRFINKSLRIYHQDAGEQISKRGPKSGAGRWFTYALELDNNIAFFFEAPLSFCKIAILGSRLAFHNTVAPQKQFLYISKFNAGLVWSLCIPFGFICFIFDQMFGRRDKDK